MRGLAWLQSEQTLLKVEEAEIGAANFLQKAERLLPENGTCQVTDCLL